VTSEDLATFFDGLVPFTLKREDVAGAVISVVKDGAVLFARGYGLADLKSHAPMSPQDTLVRPGSISKLFTWTAVMQQVEQGKLDLDHDINDYLDFKIPPYEGRPVTLRNLLTHTGGFEDVARGLLPATIAEVGLERYLKAHLPARIFPPGQIVAYSNYGCGLAGYIVQRVAKESFEDYIEHRIFRPLKMARSTFAQPLPAALAPLMARGYKSASDATPQPFELVNPAPAGSLSTTALDMAQFMIAQLHNGRHEEAQILKQATALLMHSLQYTPVQGLAGFDLGFYQEDRNGLRIVGHGGDTVVFHSDLHLLIDQDIGIFMSFNSAGGQDGGAHLARRALFDAFLDRYFPPALKEEPALSSSKADAARVAGWYLASRRNESALRLLYFLDQTRVAAHSDGTLTVAGFTDYAGKPLRWREVGPLQYRELDGQRKLDFIANPDGTLRYFATDYIPAIEIFQRMPPYKSLSMAGSLLGFAFLIILTTLLIWLFGGLARRHYGRPLQLAPDLSRTRLLSRLGVLALGIDLLGWLVLLAVAAADERVLLQDSATKWMYVLYTLGVIALLGVVAVVVHSVRSSYRGPRSLVVRVGEVLLGFAALYLAWFIPAFGLVSFSVRF
jgi:CubicO group peptidase (beta-lactamase class C family)